MKKYLNQLTGSLSAIFNWHKSRIQSFIKDIKIDFDAIAEFNVHQLLSQKKIFHLILDKTNWRFGKTDINILVFSAVYEGTAIPLYMSY